MNKGGFTGVSRITPVHNRDQLEESLRRVGAGEVRPSLLAGIGAFASQFVAELGTETYRLIGETLRAAIFGTENATRTRVQAMRQAWDMIEQFMRLARAARDNRSPVADSTQDQIAAMLEGLLTDPETGQFDAAGFGIRVRDAIGLSDDHKAGVRSQVAIAGLRSAAVRAMKALQDIEDFLGRKPEEAPHSEAAEAFIRDTLAGAPR